MHWPGLIVRYGVPLATKSLIIMVTIVVIIIVRSRPRTRKPVARVVNNVVPVIVEGGA
jgi:hypothetical protein